MILRRDYYPKAPIFDDYTASLEDEVWVTDKDGKESSDQCLLTYTSGLWKYSKKL